MASSANTIFVSILYQTVLLRQGSDDEIDAWATLLDQGRRLPVGVVNAVEGSNEVANFVLPVIRMYEAFFARAPDATGLSAWVNALRSGSWTLSQVAAGFTASSEFNTFYGTLPNPVAFVTALYEHVLQRAPDNAGLVHWVNLMNSGALSFADVALGFSQSPEFIADSTATIDKWLTTANTNAQAGTTPVYPATISFGSGSGSGTYALTTGTDVILGAPGGGNTITGILDGLAPTLQGTDIINGGVGLNNILEITSAGDATATDILPAGVLISNVQRITLTTPGNAGISASAPFDTASLPSLSNLKIVSAGPSTDFVAATSGTSVADTNTGSGASIVGGRNVTVTANGSISVENATGTVVINDTNTNGGDTINVTGATTGVSIALSGYGEHVTVGGGTPGTDPIGPVSVTGGSSNHVVSITTPIADNVTLGIGGTVQIGSFTNASGTIANIADSITVGANANITVGAIASSANGSNVIGAIDIVVGVNSMITLGGTTAPAGTNSLTETIDVSSNIAGNVSSGAYTMTTINGAVHGMNQQIAFSVELNEAFTATPVDVSSATTLAAALDLAATHMGKQGGGAVPMQTAVLTWFQYGGDTYIVDANNSTTSTPVAHTGLAANDIVVKLSGLVTPDPNANFSTTQVLVI